MLDTFDLSASAVIARARTKARIGKYKETHPGHLFLELLKRSTIQRKVQLLTGRRTIHSVVDIFLRKRPTYDLVPFEQPPLSDAAQKAVELAGQRAALRGERTTVDELDLFVGLLLLNDPIIRRGLQQLEVDYDALLEQFAPDRANA